MPCRPEPYSWQRCLGSKNTGPRGTARPQLAARGCPLGQAAIWRSETSTSGQPSTFRGNAGHY
eukprot:3040359-Pyramimonas_sp.AAC.1